MQMNDMLDLAHLIEGCAISINSGSTVSIDSLLHNKPVLLTFFDAYEPLPMWTSIRRVAAYGHLKNLVDSGGVVVADNFNNFTEQITRFLKDPDWNHTEREKIMLMECFKNDGMATERVVNAIQMTVDAG